MTVRSKVLLVLGLLAATVLAEGQLANAKQGQWVSYQLANDMRMKQTITKVEGKKITIKNEMWIKGQELPVMETPIDLDKKTDVSDKANKAEAAPAEEPDAREINGHTLRCRVRTQGNVKTWISDEVPILGIVRQELDGRPTMELTGYGQSPDEDRLKK